MIRILAILLIPAGLVLCLIHLLVVVYAVLLRAARCLTQQVTLRVCGRGQGRATAEENGVPEVVRSVKMQGLQIEAAGETAGGGCSSRSTCASKASWQVPSWCMCAGNRLTVASPACVAYHRGTHFPGCASLNQLSLWPASGDSGAAAGCILVRDEPTSLQQQEVLRLFEAHGSANANCYTAFSNPEIQVFLAPNRGCMLYTVAQHWAHTIVCATGDPLCEPQHTLSMLQLFKAAFPDAIFIDLSKAAAQLLAAEGGVTITDLGCETTIDVQQFHFEFNKVRNAAAAAAARRMSASWDEVCPLQRSLAHMLKHAHSQQVQQCMLLRWCNCRVQLTIELAAARCLLQKTKHIRRRAEVAAKAGLVVEEVGGGSSAALRDDLRQMAREW